MANSDNFIVDPTLFERAEKYFGYVTTQTKTMLLYAEQALNYPPEFPYTMNVSSICEDINGVTSFNNGFAGFLASARTNLEIKGVIPPAANSKVKGTKFERIKLYISEKMEEYAKKHSSKDKTGAKVSTSIISMLSALGLYDSKALMKEVYDSSSEHGRRITKKMLDDEMNHVNLDAVRENTRHNQEILDGINRVKIAQAHVGKHPYSQSGERSLYKSDTTDCSGFTWFLTKESGYKAPDQVWSTPTMEDYANNKNMYLKRVAPEDTQAGDFIVANAGQGSGNNGHTAVLTEPYHGLDTKIIHETSGGVQNGVVGNSTLLSGGRGSRVIFVRPMEK